MVKVLNISTRILLTVLSMLVLAGNVQAVPTYDTDFETEDGFVDGTSINGIDGWTVETGSCVTKSTNALNGVMSLELKTVGSNGSCRRSFTGNSIVTAEFKVRMKNSTSMFCFYLMDSSNNQGPCIYFNSGQLKAYNGSSIVNIASAAIETIYAIKIVANASSGIHKYDVYVDGVLKADNFSFRYSTANTLSRFRALRGTTNVGILDDLIINTGPLAFPTAEGFGAYSLGGRGGDVYRVTNLNDSGAGSLRYGIDNMTGPRTIVFAVSGTIALASELHLDSSKRNLTIAGQTAPGDGICIKNYGVYFDYPDDIIVRYIRFRPGDTEQTEVDGIGMSGVEDVIFDHCSFSWAIDQLWGFEKICDNLTVQWSIFSEALYDSYHASGSPHSMAALMSASSYMCRVTFHHNIFAHNDKRNPRAGSKGSGSTMLDWRNNVLYNWGEWCGRTGASDRPLEKATVNYVGNYLKYGPDTLTTQRSIAFMRSYDGILGVHATGNYMPHNSSATSNNWLMISGVYTKKYNPYTAPMVKTDSALTAYGEVLDHAGAFPRDSVDARIVGHINSPGYTAGAIIDSQSQVGGWPTLHSTSAPTDSDGDGMPNTWESANGLNPNSSADRNYDNDKDGYTNLEEYLSYLVGEGDGV